MAVINSSDNIINFDLVNNFIQLHPNANYFQSLGYYHFCKTLSSFDSILIVSTDESANVNGSLLAVIQKEKGYLKSKLSSRCIVYGGPIVVDNNKDVADLLLKEIIKKVGSNSIYIEFRNLFDLTGSAELFLQNGFEYKKHFNFIVNISKIDDNFIKLNENRRRQIKKSIKNGAEIVEAKEIDKVVEFYLILKKLYKDKVKKPLPDFNFFQQFHLSPDLGKIFLVMLEGRVIGGIMCPIFKDTIYEWYVCGLDSEYKNHSPSVLATWAPIEYAAKTGLKYFDFLGAGSADTDYGVREFKSKFGGALVQYGRFLRINNKLFYNIGKFGLKVSEKLK